MIYRFSICTFRPIVALYRAESIFAVYTRRCATGSSSNNSPVLPTNLLQRRKSRTPFILYDPHNIEQQKLLRNALSHRRFSDPRFRVFTGARRVEFYHNIREQVKAMYRWEHLQYSALLLKWNSENTMQHAENDSNSCNPFIRKVRDELDPVYRYKRDSDIGVWDTIDVNIVLGLIWEILSQHEIMYRTDIMKKLPQDISEMIARSFRDIRILLCRYPFTFEVVRRSYVRIVPPLTF